MMSNYTVTLIDTDSLTMCKHTGIPFTPEETQALFDEINTLTPELIKWDLEFVNNKFVVFKAKNYIIYDGKKMKKKGSALKSATKEIIFKKFSDEMIQAILDDKTNFIEIYHKYVKLCMNVTKDNIKDFASKKSISKKVMENDRTNEAKIRDTIQGTDYRIGDKIYVYFKEDGSLSLIENFDGSYDKKKILEKLYNSTSLFDSVIDTSQFLNYKLKRNQSALEELLK